MLDAGVTGNDYTFNAQLRARQRGNAWHSAWELFDMEVLWFAFFFV